MGERREASFVERGQQEADGDADRLADGALRHELVAFSDKGTPVQLEHGAGRTSETERGGPLSGRHADVSSGGHEPRPGRGLQRELGEELGKVFSDSLVAEAPVFIKGHVRLGHENLGLL